MNPALDSPRTQRFGKYALVERLGRGGMAEVWKARISGPAGFQRTLVVKRILPHLVEDPHFVQMFVSEARLSARLSHANIVQVFELGDVDGEYYLAMEYVRGRDLVNVVRAQLQHGLLLPGMAAFVAREVCRALAYAHALVDERGQPLRIVHRDVSPSNVMIGFEGGVKLLDFGIAKALAEATESKTVTGTLKGKFGYMAPEQVDGGELDHRSDLFAAGIVLHESLTGRRLFKGAHDLGTIAMVREAKVEPPSRVNAAVPPELDAICMRALARDAEARYRGCAEMAEALDEVVHQLKWGPERLAGVMRELFPDDVTTTRQIPALPEDESGSATLAGEALRARPLRRRIAWGALALALLGGGVWLGGARLSGHNGAAPAGVTGAAGANGTGGAAELIPGPSPSPTVLVRVVTQPPGAYVYIGDQVSARGQTPVALTLPRGTGSERVTVRLKGYEAQTTEVTPDSDSRLQLNLVKASGRRGGGGGSGKRAATTEPAAPSPGSMAASPAPTPPASTSAAPASAAPPPEPASLPPQAPGPNLHRGDVVDPFAPAR